METLRLRQLTRTTQGRTSLSSQQLQQFKVDVSEQTLLLRHQHTNDDGADEPIAITYGRHGFAISSVFVPKYDDLCPTNCRLHLRGVLVGQIAASFCNSTPSTSR